MSAAALDLRPTRALSRLRPRGPGRGKLLAGVSILAVITLAGVLASVLSPHDPLAQDISSRLLAPSLQHPFGTDALGRDVFSRTLHAIRLDLPLALAGALLPGILGVVVGAVAGLAGPRTSRWIMRVADVTQAFPQYVLFILVAFVLSPGVTAFLVGVLLVSWVSYTRIVRSQVLTIRELDYYRAAVTSRSSRTRVLFRHVLPNAMPQAIVYFTSDVVIALLALSGLSYLGLGVPQPTPEWGSMIADGQAYLRNAWWLTTFPGLAIVVSGLAFSLLNEGLDDRNRR